MRLGCCGGIDVIDDVKSAGFDFLEVGVQPVLRGNESDAEWAKSAPDPDKLPLPLEAANSLVPGSMPIIGPGRDVAALRTYMQRVAQRACKLGIKRLVFGSGGARKRPDGVDDATAHQHLVEFTKLAGDACAANDVMLVIEHLNAGETNTLNKLRQAKALCDEVASPGVSMLVDSYHYGLEQEQDEAILELGDSLNHVHVAEVDGRWQPFAGRGESFDFEHFFCLLRKIGYDQRVSIECKWSQPIAEVGAQTARKLRQVWAAAGRCD